jgi:hypothetical protein
LEVAPVQGTSTLHAAAAYPPVSSPPPPEVRQRLEEPPAQAPGQYFSPGDVHAAGPYSSPGELPPPQSQLPVDFSSAAGPVPYTESVKANEINTKFVVAFCVAALLIVAALAGAYFTVLKKYEPTEPEKVVLKYFESLGRGDINAFVSCFTQQAAPDQAALAAIDKALSTGKFKYEDIKLKTLNQTATDAEVQIKDFTVNASAGGQTVKMKMSKLMSGSQIKLKLVNSNGAWLINSKYQFSTSGGVI